MKNKITITFLALSLMVTTTLFANSRAGFVTYTDGGAGLYLTSNDLVLSGIVSNTSIEDTSVTSLRLAGAVNVRTVGDTSVLVGASYLHIFSDVVDHAYELAFTLGVEHFLAPNIKLLTSVDLLSFASVQGVGESSVETSTLFSTGRVGIAYLF